MDIKSNFLLYLLSNDRRKGISFMIFLTSIVFMIFYIPYINGQDIIDHEEIYYDLGIIGFYLLLMILGSYDLKEHWQKFKDQNILSKKGIRVEGTILEIQSYRFKNSIASYNYQIFVKYKNHIRESEDIYNKKILEINLGDNIYIMIDDIKDPKKHDILREEKLASI